MSNSEVFILNIYSRSFYEKSVCFTLVIEIEIVAFELVFQKFP